MPSADQIVSGPTTLTPFQVSSLGLKEDLDIRHPRP